MRRLLGGFSAAVLLSALAPALAAAQDHEGHNRPAPPASAPATAPAVPAGEPERAPAEPAEETREEAAHPEPHRETAPAGGAEDQSDTMPGMEHGGHGGAMAGPLGIPMSREGSGTSWLPDSSPMYGLHAVAGDWAFMFHENLFGTANFQGGPRGAAQAGSINWVMGMARGPALGGELTARAMLSLEPFTVGEQGYPLLLQTGEGLVDRQHPHDLFMELAAQYRRELSDNLALSIYGGPVAEPALGPTAYPHRPSAFPSPLAPLTHHWIDSTHITFGVVTAGLYTRRVMLEGSVFNASEPSEIGRTDIEVGPLDSVSARLTVAPTADVSAQVSVARLKEPEAAHPGDVTRATASIIYNRRLARGANWASTAAAGVNFTEESTSLGVLLETSLDTRGPSVFFGRAEAVGKPAEELAAPGERIFPVGALSLGYVYEAPFPGGFVAGIGVQGAVSAVPEALAPVYGGRVLPGGVVFFRLRPEEMQMTPPPARAAR